MINIQELIERFLEETNYDENDNILAIIAYGSRVTKTNNYNSDLDILVVSNSKNNYVMGRIIDGVKIDCHIYSIHEMQNCLYINSNTGNRFFDSVLKNGIIIKNKDNILNILKEELESFNKRKIKSKKLSFKTYKDIHDFYRNYIIACQNDIFHYQKDYWYYNLLELLRKSYHYVNKYCYLNIMKVYDIYTNKEYYENLYQGQLPNDEFLNVYIEAVTEKDDIKRKEYLVRILKILNIDINDLSYLIGTNDTNIFYGNFDIKNKLLEFNNKVNKVIDMLLVNHPYATCSYCVLIKQIFDVYSKLFFKKMSVLDELTKSALLEKDNDKKIDWLQKIFMLLDENYKLDYDDYYLLKKN